MYGQAKTAQSGWGLRRLSVAVAAVTLLAVTPSSYANEPLVEPRNMGGGITRGSIQYAPTPMPQAGAICKRNITFTLGGGTAQEPGWSSEAFVFNTVISGFEGPVTITGDGTSGNSCESYALGGGTMTLSVRGLNPITESTLDCREDDEDPRSTNLTGTYTRVLSDMTLILNGVCVVNKFATGRVMLVARIQVAPMGGGAGALAPISSAMTAGVFAVAPA